MYTYAHIHIYINVYINSYIDDVGPAGWGVGAVDSGSVNVFLTAALTRERSEEHTSELQSR